MPEQDFFPVSPDSAARRLKAIRGCTNVATPSYRRFGKDFFDNLSIGYGYGGYAYDGRHRGPAERMADHYGLIAGQRVLDVGCAKGFLMVEFAGLGLQVAGLDVSRYAAQTAHIDVRNRIVTGDMNQELPWNDRSFDLVICKEVLPYLPPSKQAWALRELTRVAKKPEAVFIEIQCGRFTQEIELMRQWDGLHQTIATPAWWQRMFDAAGYKGDWHFKVLFPIGAEA
uniref:Putative methyltransferase n=1 Tax=viral metagenome TaxID=1070528 RepID=A0A6M3JKZ5_9ZZZZ